jgi:long-chain acyl-CoA synthetase
MAEMIGKISGRVPVQLSPDARLDDQLNLSSLDRVELLSALEDRYQIDLSETSFANASTVGDVEKMLLGDVPVQKHQHYPRWAQRWPVTWIRLAGHYLLMRPIVYVMARPTVEGLANLRGVRGPVLVVCNHLSDVDIGLVKFALPVALRHRVAVATGGEELEALRSPSAEFGFFRRGYNRLKWALAVALLNLFPLPREAGFRESFAFAGESVDRGYSILVFPEGRHAQDGKLLPFRSGVGLLVNNLHLPIVPMRIDGLFEAMQTGRRFAPAGKIKVKIGQPATFESGTDPRVIAAELEKIVAEL